MKCTNFFKKMKELNKANKISKKPGTALVGAISKGQKQQKDFKVSKYSLLRYRKNPKVEPNWRTRGDTLKFFNRGKSLLQWKTVTILIVLMLLVI